MSHLIKITHFGALIRHRLRTDCGEINIIEEMFAREIAYFHATDANANPNSIGKRLSTACSLNTFILIPCDNLEIAIVGKFGNFQRDF